MKLYYSALSSNSRRARAVAYQLALDVEQIDTDFAKLRDPEFVRLNPNSKIPVLVDGGFVLWESNAIMQYLCEKAGDTKLWPKELQKRMDVVRWQFWVNAHLGASTLLIMQERVIKKMFNTGAPTNEGALAEGLAMFDRFAKVLDECLDGRKYLVGDDVTLADYAVVAPLMYRIPAELPVDGYKRMLDWCERIESLEPYKKAGVPHAA
jgi:glutathione S-transferase